MKSVELFCASPASTAICSSTDQRSMVRQGGIRPLDRHGHRLGDHHHRNKTRPSIPCSSHPISPSPRPNFDKNRKIISSPKQNLENLRRKSSSDITDISIPPPPPPNRSLRYLPSDTSSALVPSQPVKFMSARYNNFDDYPVFRSSMSSRIHSFDNPVYEISSSFRSNDDFHAQKSSSSRLIDDYVNAQKSSLSRTNTIISYATKSLETSSSVSHSSKSPSARGLPRHQVVELRVSIHCKGCEGKIRKHLSKMEGVTSYSIDLDTKKVTVIGNVTPLGVLTSISKVKNAEFWSSPTPSSASSSPTVGTSLVST